MRSQIADRTDKSVMQALDPWIRRVLQIIDVERSQSQL